METRKVQLSGGTTYTVSLPKTWANEHGIESGSVLTLHPNGDGSLLVEASRDRSATERSTTVDVATDSENALRQRIRALHAVGFDSVTLLDTSGHGKARRALVEETVAELSGFELLEAGDTRIRLTNLIDAQNVDVRKSALRLRLVMLSMHRDAVDSVIDADESLARRVVDRDGEADKLFAMVTRHFRRALTDLHEVEKLDHGRDELFEYYYASRQFERVADHAVKMAKFVIDPEAAVPAAFADRLSTLAASSRQVVDDAADVILADAGIDAAHSALAERDRLADGLTELDRELYSHDDPAEAYVVGLLLDSIRRTAEYGMNIAGVAIQQTVREGMDD
ncbi:MULTISPECIES: phosphate signaling complex PhoU family protein [Haloarcula]|uniref:Histidine kinase n=1 Tax=Haloarcula pellucida TaxID=1427151 RepID=A0A830GNJ5_9EURY|nr:MULTISPECIES: phosphate uptake regulator PhoU [Halomicroarcula]MBX0348198.1 phosphate uptake regulator PhoU [Halomicroarcula pellucida]MDS0278053.1 phosphate uptake regulator PhoU [Halomicroarcula sp. S1AR25-4]GGN97445.1 histidine kinase [Halomicroarcula pellucida]